MNLIERSASKGGRLVPLLLPEGNSSALMNPSIFIDDDGDILVNIRHVNYTLYNAENNQRFPTIWGPLAYLHPENDLTLRTINYICRLNENLEITDYTKVDTSQLDVAPLWEFHGEEDCRLVKWDGSYYLIGVRRDTTTNGEGRMEYSKIDLDKKNWIAREVSRLRIPAPGPNTSYCEKNWMPILDQPYHFVKWTMPTEIVWANPNTPETKTVKLVKTPQAPRDQRGGTPIIKWKDYYITITHEVWLWWNYLNQKDSVYRHRLAVWDKDFNFIGLSKDNFSFLGSPIEFCISAAVYQNDLLLGFGVQDNCAFIMRTPEALVDELIKEAIDAYVVGYDLDDVYEIKDYGYFRVYKDDLISESLKRGEKWEPFLHDIFEKYVTKDSIVLEGGSHIGSHTVKLAQLAKEVISFEPLEESFTLLQENIKLNNLHNVIVNKAGLSDKVSTTSFAYVNPGNIGGAVLADAGDDVLLTTIDSLGLDKLDFIKLDIEGYEKQALLGGLETIKRCKPVITVECWDVYPNASLEHATSEFQFLLDIGYTITQIEHHDFLFEPTNV